jgi:predicted nucleic acid-binding protein
VPAFEHAFLSPPPQRLYIDTDIVTAYLVDTQEHHRRCQAFLERLYQFGQTTLYLSSLLWIEFTHVIRRVDFRNSLAADLRASLHLNEWERPLVRQKYLRTLVRSLEDLLEHFAWVEIPLTPDIRAAALEYISEYNLGSQDAVHLASATSAAVLEFASLDRSFRRIEGLSLWNDRIHAGQSE